MQHKHIMMPGTGIDWRRVPPLKITAPKPTVREKGASPTSRRVVLLRVYAVHDKMGKCPRYFVEGEPRRYFGLLLARPFCEPCLRL